MAEAINVLIQKAYKNFQDKKEDAAIDILKKILLINPLNFDANHMLGVILGIQGQPKLAKTFLKKSVEIDPKNYFASFNYAKSLVDSGEYIEAIFYSENAIKIDPKNKEAWNNYGVNLKKLKFYSKSIECYEKALTIDPDYLEALVNKSDILIIEKKFNEALIVLDRALLIVFPKKDIELVATPWINRGVAFLGLGKSEDALVSFNKAIDINSNHPEAWYNKGVALQSLKRYDEAKHHYDQAIKLKPDFGYLFGMSLHMKMFMCDWQDFKVKVENLLLQTNENKKSCFCYSLLALTDSPSIQRKSSEIWINDKHPFNSLFGPILKSRHRDKIKIGYYSPDFREHPVAYVLAELLELHDKNQFELFGFYFGPPDSSKMHKRISSAFNQFIDVELKSDKDIALMSREMGIDIAVDLTGFTGLARTDIFSYRAAPIQVNYLGYPGTIGAEYIDYIIADPIIIPTESQQYYSEKIVYLPNSYLVYDTQRSMPDRVFTKDELGLPKDSFVFCCFNNNHKITPNTFDGWVRILKAVKGSVLWLLEDNPIAASNLRKEAQFRGLDPNRLVFAKRMDPSEYLARNYVADLFIDTFPYNAHSTATDALWAGLPILTYMGESFASRVAASLLNAIELPELIATTQEQYEARAIELATNPEKLKAIKYKLERNRLTTALFDTPRFTKHIEAAYKQMYERYQADLQPNNIYIEN